MENIETKNPKRKNLELTILMPCLNEAETLGTCIEKANNFLSINNVSGEILIADNGSTDDSIKIASQMGAKVINVKEKGYGATLIGGINEALGEYIIMGDSDDSYDFTDLMPFLIQLRKGYDLVMGNRFLGGIMPGAMPPLHRYLGNPLLTGIGRLFFKCPVSDFHCGLRGFRKKVIKTMDLQTSGMEFASEMVIKATLYGLKITEVPIVLHRDGRSRPPHLRSWRDGWRHLRFMLLYSPNWLFLYPGLFLIIFGGILGMWLLPAPRPFLGTTLDVHTLLYSSLFVLVGYQAITFAVFSKIYVVNEGLLPAGPKYKSLFKYINLEVGLFIGTTLLLIGIGGSIYLFINWGNQSFGVLKPTETMRLVIPFMLSIAIGSQTIVSSFFLSILGLRRIARKT
jgi:glycosyltransferase involved in cell wall biosynthesis